MFFDRDGRSISQEAWSQLRALGEDYCRVAYDVLDGDVEVSTVWIGISIRMEPPPQMFETMIFGGAFDQWQERSSSWAEAQAVHAKWLQVLQLEAAMHQSK
jgi:hypothetical protein